MYLLFQLLVKMGENKELISNALWYKFSDLDINIWVTHKSCC